MMKKEVCIKFLDDIKSRADRISVQSQSFKHLGLDITKDDILKKQSKIRERLHTGAVGFTDWCYAAVTDFVSARFSMKFPGVDIFTAIDALQEGDIASDMDIRQFHTVFKKIFMYDEISGEDKKQEGYLEILEYFSDNKYNHPKISPMTGRLLETYTEKDEKMMRKCKPKVVKKKQEKLNPYGHPTGEMEEVLENEWPFNGAKRYYSLYVMWLDEKKQRGLDEERKL